jgi:hypothetical protein
MYPLSAPASALLNQELSVDLSLTAALKDLILKSYLLIEFSIRKGAVVRCSDELVIKIFPSSRDPTEYYSPVSR